MEQVGRYLVTYTLNGVSSRNSLIFKLTLYYLKESESIFLFNFRKTIAFLKGYHASPICTAGKSSV